jgi:carboxymethylenebutenolidase
MKSLANCTGKLGVIGYCSGGRQVVLFSCNTNSLSAAITCYGGRVVMAPEQLTERMPKAPIDMISGLNVPLLGLHGDEDQNPSPDMVEQLRQELEKQGKTFEFHSFENAGHAFFADYRPSYRQHAAVDGWEKVFDWYGKHLS